MTREARLLIALNDVEARDRLVRPHTVSEARSLEQPSFVFDSLCAFRHFDHPVDAGSEKADSLCVAHEHKHPPEVPSFAYDLGLLGTARPTFPRRCTRKVAPWRFELTQA